MKRFRILLVSLYFYLNSSNGASISARKLLFGFSERGLDVSDYYTEYGVVAYLFVTVGIFQSS